MEESVGAKEESVGAKEESVGGKVGENVGASEEIKKELLLTIVSTDPPRPSSPPITYKENQLGEV